MKFWEKFSNHIYNLAASVVVKKYHNQSIENTLSNSLKLLDNEINSEIEAYVKRKFSPNGFLDKAGNGDLYYSLFGGFLLETFNLKEYRVFFTKYILSSAKSNQIGVYHFCQSVLYAKFIGINKTSNVLRNIISLQLSNPKIKQPHYFYFLFLLALFYLKDYYSINQLIKKINLEESTSSICTLKAVELLIKCLQNKNYQEEIQQLKSFYQPTGGFKALHQAPVSDLLSTAVALYALHFVKADLRDIKSDCLNFIDSLYVEGGFKATVFDNDDETDIEYTFYGLLALGSLSN